MLIDVTATAVAHRLKMEHMSSNRRDIFEIIYSILRLLSSQSLKKTHIGHKANLDTFTLNKYLDMLIKLDLIDHRPEFAYYSILPKGHNYLQEYKKLSTLIKKKSQLIEAY